VPSRYHIEAAGSTDRGRRRPRNEDAFIAIDDLGLFAVADGVSTRPHGAMASEFALERVITFLKADRTWPMEADDALGLLVAAVRHANEHLHHQAWDWPRGEGPATTFAGMLVHDAHACIAHVGDSRVYLLRDGDLTALTEDHSYAAEYMRLGATPEDARKMRDARVLTRALGLGASVDVTGHLELLKTGDVLMACSDGLYGVVPAPEVKDLLTDAVSADVAVDQLIARANGGGGPDNIAVVVVRVARGVLE
jgi:protein phosphatase